MEAEEEENKRIVIGQGGRRREGDGDGSRKEEKIPEHERCNAEAAVAGWERTFQNLFLLLLCRC